MMTLVASNMHRTHALPQDSFTTRYQYNSKWIPLEEVGQYVFDLHIRRTYNDDGPHSIQNYPDQFLHKFKSLKIKLMHDMYFEQINSWDQQNNSTQVNTYVVSNFPTPIHFSTLEGSGLFSTPEDSLSEYVAGNVVLANDTITVNHQLVNSISGDTIFINAENISISGSLEVQPGYSLVLQALNQIHVIPGGNVSNNIHLRIKKDFYDTPVSDYISNSDVYNFCNNSSQYQANTASRSLIARTNDKPDQAENENPQTTETGNTVIKIYPNPAASDLTIQSEGNGIDRLSIFDSATRPVIQKTSNGSNLLNLDINNLSPGIYIVRVDCGGEVLTEKLVVAK